MPGSAAAYGRDATVAWNYVDLRFTDPRRFGLMDLIAGDQGYVDLKPRLLKSAFLFS